MSEYLEKIKSLSFRGEKIGRKATSDDICAITGRDSELGEIAKDKVLFKNITSGNASDKSLKRDVQNIMEDRTRRNDWRPKAKAAIEKRKEFHRAKWGKDSIQ